MRTKEPQLDLPHMVRITSECHEILKDMKKEKKQSMAKMVCDLIIKEYEK